MDLQLRTPSEQEFKEICDHISEFELDNRALQREQFSAAFRQGKLVGFGRLREHAECVELCSLGVVAAERRKGIGKAVVAELIRRAPGDLYLVCIIPDFFHPFGFRIVEDYPSAISNKLNYCTSELVVPETYTAMLLRK